MSRHLVPDPQVAIPTAGADGHAVCCDSQTTDPVFVGCEDSDTVVQQGVPYVAVKVVVAGEEESSALAEADGGDAADYGFVTVRDKFLVRSDVEQAACCVVRSGRETHTVGEEGDCVDVALVSGEGLFAHAVAGIPQLSAGVTRT